MPLVKSPRMTAAKLAANRANAQKTGPRTWRGKGRVTLNALKHGRNASKFFRSNLARNRQEVGLYDWIYQQICEHLRVVKREQRRDAEELAREVWCFFRNTRRAGMQAGLRAPRRSSVWCLLRVPTSMTGGFRTNPRYAVKPTDTYVTFPTRFDVPVKKTGIRLRFWTRRRRTTGAWLQRQALRQTLSEFLAPLLASEAAISSGTTGATELGTATPNPAATDGPRDSLGQDGDSRGLPAPELPPIPVLDSGVSG